MAETNSTDLAIRDNQTGFDQKQLAALKQMGVQGASNADLAIFFHQARRTGLDPFLRQIYMIGRRVYENEQWAIKQTIQTGIDGFRLVASRRDGGYSLSPVEYMRDDGQWVGAWLKPWGNPLAARVTLTKGNGAQFTSTLAFEEYAQTKKNGDLNSQWSKMPAHMLEKCVEADVIRKAYPQDLSGLYSEDEMGEPEPVAVASRPAAATAITAPQLTIVQNPPVSVPGKVSAAAVGDDASDGPASARPRHQRPRPGEVRETGEEGDVSVSAGPGGGGEAAPAPAGTDLDTGEIVDIEIGEIVDAEIVELEDDDQPPSADDRAAADRATKFQITQIHLLAKELELDEATIGRAGYLENISRIVGRPVASSKDLTQNEADYLIGEWQKQSAQAAQPIPCTKEQREEIGKELKRLGMADKDECLAFFTATAGRAVGATVDMSAEEARQVLKALRGIKDDQPNFPPDEDAVMR